jgi:hypothetical protein
MSISVGETADRVLGAPCPDAEPSVREPWEAAPNTATRLSGARR